MSITVTVSDPALLAAVTTKANQQPKTPEQFLQDFLTGSCHVWRDEFALDRVTSSDFMFRFTAEEFAGINASADPVIQDFIAQVKAAPFVWLGAAAVIGGMDYVVAQGLLTAERAAAILSYPVPAPYDPNAPVEPPSEAAPVEG